MEGKIRGRCHGFENQSFLGRAQGIPGLTLAGFVVSVPAAGVSPLSLSDSSLLSASSFPAWAWVATGPAFPGVTAGAPFWDDSLAEAEVPLT